MHSFFYIHPPVEFEFPVCVFFWWSCDGWKFVCHLIFRKMTDYCWKLKWAILH